MKSNKKIIIAAIAILVVVGVGLWATGSLETTSTNLDGQEINLAAAASLKNAYDNDLIPMFEEKYPGVKVTPTYASSGDLQSQIENGLEADVFMSAANKQMDALADEGLIDNSTNVQFLENKVVLIVPKDSSSNISSFNDLKNVKGHIAIGDPESVPAGQYAKEALTNLGIWDDVKPKLSLGTDVTAVLNQVAQGSAECGIVYSTDAKSTDEVKVVCEAPEDALKTPVIYPVAVLKDSKDPDAAKAFVEFLQTKEAKDIFVKYGFTIHE
ncbi:molybdate ABC transporter substrate-binding protein [Methanobrevibacter olleyae]|uniref:Molybdate ABC transporter substrate-binding protein ModA n=1 Tax=Methanobrevibacter olleyae TaxID=294671 RepID=A0A126R0Y5_METOL|nr:molybdate ABC transporter substrate-binding protein [Methanobrevibacter olleyae]AMK15619.1 molybdate ABC transporter substrate-binding protein ModA [Methanobrevibacter olleyae]SFL24660.1 molybdate transport system substrate-binding protein [Methanobrevibacter olleyae]